MFIQTQDTPNPNTVKFVLNEELLTQGSVSLTRGTEGLALYPVAIKLFEIEDVNSLFISQNFISVTKEDYAEWEVLKTIVLSELLDLQSQNLPLVLEASQSSSRPQSSTENAESQVEDSIIVQIKELIETKVRPAVAMDGGDIIFHDFKEGTVYLELHGACSGCPSSSITLKNGIENMLKHYIPEVESVEAV